MITRAALAAASFAACTSAAAASTDRQSRTLRLRAFNGDVRLTLAERPANARILALALNGHITSEIPLTMRDTWGPRWGEATLGRGEPVISIDVVTGTVDLRSP